MFPYKFGRHGQNYVSQQDYHLEYHTIAIKIDYTYTEYM